MSGGAMLIYVKKTQATRDQLLALSDELYSGSHIDKGITDFHYGFGEREDIFEVNFEIPGTEKQIAFIKLIEQSFEIVKIEPARDGKEYEEEAIQWWRNTLQSSTSQEAATKPNSFDIRIQSWDTEILSVDKRFGRLVAFGALVILAGMFIFLVGSYNEGATAEVIAVVSIIAAAVLLLQTNKSHKKAIKRLTGEIQQACEDEGFDKREVVKTLYRHQNRKVPDAARIEILRTVDRDIFLGLLRQAPVEYFESPPPKGDGRCSDKECPCPETPIPRGQGFLYIPPQVVEMRRDARTMKALRAKLERTKQHDEIMSQFRHAIVVPRQGLYHPILMCRQGAERRGIDLEVAAKDAAFWWQTGRVPLRPTPRTSARKPKP